MENDKLEQEIKECVARLQGIENLLKNGRVIQAARRVQGAKDKMISLLKRMQCCESNQD